MYRRALRAAHRVPNWSVRSKTLHNVRHVFRFYAGERSAAKVNDLLERGGETVDVLASLAELPDDVQRLLGRKTEQ